MKMLNCINYLQQQKSPNLHNIEGDSGDTIIQDRFQISYMDGLQNPEAFCIPGRINDGEVILREGAVTSAVVVSNT